jgi:hypothetical protein
MRSDSGQRGRPSTPAWRNGRRRLAHFGMQVAVLCCIGTAAVADDSKRPVYNTVVYYPKNGNYYELAKPDVEHLKPGTRFSDLQKHSWDAAYKHAAARSHKGVRGRLAVVNDPYLNEFLKNTFRPHGIAWIGLRYWCHYNRLQWVTGQFLEPGDFAAWDTPWASGTVGRNTSGLTKPDCGGAGSYWPAHFWGVESGGRWNANGQTKQGNAFFVEYPTGRK